MLTAAEAKIANLEAAAVVDAQIIALPVTNAITLGDKLAVTVVRAAYEGLTAERKALVTQLEVLTAAEAKITDLEAEAEAAGFITSYNFV